jgi:hypothetical protein
MHPTEALTTMSFANFLRETDAVGILEQDRVVARRPAVFLRRANDRDTERLDEFMRRVDVVPRAGAEADVMQTDALLHEALALVLGCWLRYQNAGAAADAVVAVFVVEHLPQAEEGQELHVEGARDVVAAGCDLDMGDAVDLDHVQALNALPAGSLRTIWLTRNRCKTM